MNDRKLLEGVRWDWDTKKSQTGLPFLELVRKMLTAMWDEQDLANATPDDIILCFALETRAGTTIHLKLGKMADADYGRFGGAIPAAKLVFWLRPHGYRDAEEMIAHWTMCCADDCLRRSIRVVADEPAPAYERQRKELLAQ